jgi:hypothetical protein
MPSINACQKQNQIFTVVLYKNKEHKSQRTNVTLSSLPELTLLALLVSLEVHYVIIREYLWVIEDKAFSSLAP